MHEAAIAQIDADVRERVVEGVEENQIAGLEIGPVERLGGFADRQAVVGQLDAGHLVEDMVDEAAAIESGLGRRAAQAIRASHQADRIDGYVVGRRGMRRLREQNDQHG